MLYNARMDTLTAGFEAALKRAGKRAREEREARGWTMGELGERAGVTLQTVWQFETHKLRDVKLSTVWNIAGALGVPVSELLG